MSTAKQIRESIEALDEAPMQNRSGETLENNVKVNIETLIRESSTKGRYDFNKGFMSFQDMIDNPGPYLQKYRKEASRETVNLLALLGNLQKNPKFTDKEKYLRQGWEARGFSNGKLILIWYKDKSENLMIFARGNSDLAEVRDFLKHFSIIR